MDYARAHYDDGNVACDEVGMTIHHYYPWGARHILHGEILEVSVLPLGSWTALQPWRIWGPVDLEHWWNLDLYRAERQIALVIDTGERFKPTITPADPVGFERVVRAQLQGAGRLREIAAEARLGSVLRIPAQRSVEEIVPEPTTRVRS